MKDWRRSPEPPAMMGVPSAAYAATGNWGQPDELSSDPATPCPHATPARAHSSNSLYTMCLRVVLRNISSVQDLGVLPYRHAKPILEECRVEQLIALEDASPHLLAHTDEIWRRNCLRDFLELRRKYSSADAVVPKEPRSWRKLYLRTRGEIEQAKTDAAKRIKHKYEQHRAEKDAKKLVVRDRPLMAKAARAGGRRFGAVGGAGGVSKGQSLMNKARSGSAAQAKLTAPRNGRPVAAYRTQGRSRAVGAEIAPEAAGVEVKPSLKPMVAPRRVLGGSSEGLARMREFSKPLPSETPPSNARKAAQRPDVESTDAESTTAPRLKSHEVAAAPALTPSTSRDRLRTADAPHKRASSPPPDMARTERRKLDFFGSSSAARASSSSSTAATGSNSSPRGGPSPLSPGSTTAAAVEVRGVKRASSHSVKGEEASSSKAAASPPAGSPTPFFPSRAAAGGSGGVRVVQAKRARVHESARGSPPRASPAVDPPAKAVETGSDSRPGPVRRQSSSMSIARTPPVKDVRLARASPAALSSIFMPSPSAAHRNGAANAGSGRNGSSRS
ncbi:uncharacterized protein SRS1_15107 [Sporisorium reilianum f. sp. reilianum]|uniref:Elongin-A n=1 Tax=Sporisorium reilianum f. sp. reilianum TaxID=72559 RepID=A0A2N8UHM8_9BASI|nr:uncharacterized protein SRS1_15107 [Sporisorium reilianum f. sp. reilianum]